VRIDATPPNLVTMPFVPLDGFAWTDLDSLTVLFGFVDTESDLRSVEVAIGSSEELYDVLSPLLQAYPENGRLELNNLPLINSQTYYVGVRAENQAGAWSDWAWSDEVLVAIPGPVSTMTYSSGRMSETVISIDISVTDPRDYPITLGDLRMRSATKSGEEWSWSDWERISNARSSVMFEGKRGFRYQFKYRAQNELGSWGDFVEYDESYFVFINNPPVANGGPDQLSKEGDDIQFSADASEDRDDDPMSYHWDFSDGATSDQLYATHKFDKPGLYVVTLTVSDGFEESTARVTVYIEEQQETPGFGPWAAALALLGATLLAGGISRERRR
jgi:hypothetical protein